MSSGDKDVGAGPSQPIMSVEDKARKANLKFWRLDDDLSGSDEEAEEAAADEVGEGAETAAAPQDEEAEEAAAPEDDSESEYDFEAEDADDAGSSNGDEEDDTSRGGDRRDVGGSDAAAKKKKKERQDRKPAALGTNREEFTVVKPTGQPVEPAKLAAGYGIQLGCIVRESMTINQTNIRAKGQTKLCELLIEKLHNRYKFPEPFDNKNLKGNKVNKLALTRMSTALSSWKSRVKNRILDGKSWEEIKKSEPMLDEDEFIKFKAACSTPEGIEWTEWGRRMRDLNIGNQRCGSGGYRGKEAIWAKEDAEYERLGKENPWDKFTDPQVMRFVRARYYLHPVLKEFVTDDEEVRKFQKLLVRNLPRISSRFAFSN